MMKKLRWQKNKRKKYSNRSEACKNPKRFTTSKKWKRCWRRTFRLEISVHILGVNEVVRLKGKGFQQIRQRVNNLNTEKCECYDVDISEHYDIIKLLSIEWVSDFPYDTYMKEDLVSPIETLLKLMKHSELNICGQIIDYEGIPSAFVYGKKEIKLQMLLLWQLKR